MAFDPLDAYAGGLMGCKPSPRSDEVFADYILRHGGQPDGAAVAHEWEFADAGKGKLILLHPVVERVFGNVFPGPPQVTGDCFPAGTAVLMADGSEKPIEDVSVGDVVVSHTGTPRVVQETIRKPYSGELVSLGIKNGGKEVSCTPDHRIYVGGEGDGFWCRADLLTVGTEVLLPRHAPEGIAHTFDLEDNPRAVSSVAPGRNVPPTSAEKARWLHMKHEVNRFVSLDSRLAWLVGLYLAEGSMDSGKHGPQRITFNLGKHEHMLAEMVASMIEEVFGVRPKVSSVPSKPTVVYVRVTSPAIASLFAKLAPGNTYTKRPSRLFFSSPRAVRIAVLRGWFAGDGHFKSFRSAKTPWSGYDSVQAVGVSVCRSMVSDMFDLANSCGLSASVTPRKARNASRAASCVVMYGEHAFEAFPGEKHSHDIKIGAAKNAGEHGIWKKVTSVSREAFAGEVYCLQVAEDHSFIANGIAVHNCVARAAAWALLTSTAFEIDAGKPDEITGRVEEAPQVPEKGVKSGVISSVSLWAWRGYDRDGWICSEAAKVASEQGFLLCKPYPDLKIDLTEYGEHNIGLGGSRAPSKAWLDESKQHVARTATFLKGREQVRDMLHRGYGVFNCSSMAFERTRDDSGWAFSRQVGVWHHAQQYLGYDDRPETHKRWGQALVLWNNSHWGKWNSGPRQVYGTDIEIPHGTFWTLASTIDRATNIALSSVAGWPRRTHTTFGATGNV